MQKEQQNMIERHEKSLDSSKQQWTSAMERTTDIYDNLIDRIQTEHSNTVERLNELKDIEIKAALSANSQAK